LRIECDECVYPVVIGRFRVDPKNQSFRMTFEDACGRLEDVLQARSAILEGFLSRASSFGRLRAAMREHTFQTGSGTVSIEKLVFEYDERAQREGLHLLHAWDFQKHVFSDEIAPVLLLDHSLALQREADDRMAAGILLDVYFYSVLSLLAVRAWDEGDPNENLDRVAELMRLVETPYVDDAESLLFLAVSYYHPEESCYGRLLEKARTLDEPHRVRLARSCGAMLGAHLRWGYRYMYDRDAARMRDDNVVDYPWLAFAIETLERDADRNPSPEADEALLLAVAADPEGYVLQLESDPAELARRFLRLQAGHRTYSPLAFTCNFPANAAVALVASSLEDGRAWPSLNTLFRRERESAQLAERLMKWSASDPSRLGHGGVPLNVHDPAEGVRAWNAVMRELPGTQASG
jgi:hypothetical protein